MKHAKDYIEEMVDFVIANDLQEQVEREANKFCPSSTCRECYIKGCLYELGYKDCDDVIGFDTGTNVGKFTAIVLERLKSRSTDIKFEF